MNMRAVLISGYLAVAVLTFGYNAERWNPSCSAENGGCPEVAGAVMSALWWPVFWPLSLSWELFDD